MLWGLNSTVSIRLSATFNTKVLVLNAIASDLDLWLTLFANSPYYLILLLLIPHLRSIEAGNIFTRANMKIQKKVNKPFFIIYCQKDSVWDCILFSFNLYSFAASVCLNFSHNFCSCSSGQVYIFISLTILKTCGFLSKLYY